MLTVLITGGAGYIGSHAVHGFLDAGYKVVVLDDLSTGVRENLAAAAQFYQGDIADRTLLDTVLRQHQIDGVLHFAGSAIVPASVGEPASYYRNNAFRSLELLDFLISRGVKRFLFSSSAAVYGIPANATPVSEASLLNPLNPYGWSKLIMEKILQAYDDAFGLRFVALRYFNAAGATAKLGEHHEPETHLIPNLLAVALGRKEYVSVFGDQYATPDGTAIRDYIHIADLCNAHLLALEYLRNGGASECLNLGNEHGYSVMEVIATARQITGGKIEVRVEPPRPGDPSCLVADAGKARSILGWKPKYPELERIIRTAWDWHRAHPEGYEQ